MPKSTKKPHARKARTNDDAPTGAQVRRARDKAIMDGAHARPPNRLIHRDPAETVAACRRIIDWVAHIEQPFSGEELEAAEADVLHLVVDGLEHVERQLNGFWSEPISAGGGS